MKQSIYLHSCIVNVLKCYGDLDEVINKILYEGAKGTIEIMDKPPCPDRDGASRYDVDITDENYLQLLSYYSPYSSKISIRRLIYWFVENEMYNELGWTQSKSYESRELKLFNNKLSNATSELQKSKRYNVRFSKEIDNICEQISLIMEKVKNGR